jgi:hypothetical protein
MSATKTRTHQYEIGEVLRRGVPLEQNPKTCIDVPPPSDPIELFLHSYRSWLSSSNNRLEIAKAYGQLFSASEHIIGDDNLVNELDHMNAPHLMVGLIGGDVELGLMELVDSWSVPKDKRDELRNSVATRLRREGRRVRSLNHQGNIHLEESNDDEYIPVSLDPKVTIGKYMSDPNSEGIRLAMQLAAHETLGELFEFKTGPPQRGIKNVGKKIMQLAITVAIARSVLMNTLDTNATNDIFGAILEAETLLLAWHASHLGILKNAWPIAASQRLDHGYFRAKYDGPNTDFICLFPQEELAIPMQVHAADEAVGGEASRAVVIHRKDIHTRISKIEQSKSAGSIALGFLGEKGGASQDYIDMRATFVASKINGLTYTVRARENPWYINGARAKQKAQPEPGVVIC